MEIRLMFFSKTPIQQCIKPREQRSVLCCSENLVSEKQANKARSGRTVGVCAIYKPFYALLNFTFGLILQIAKVADVSHD